MPFIPDKINNQKKGFTPDKYTLGGFGENILRSGGETVGGIANTFLHPVQTAKNIGSIIKNPSVLKDYFIQRYGSLEKAKNSFYNDPVGVALDVSTIAGGTGALLKGIGSASKIGELGRVGNVFSKVARFSDPFEIAGRGVSKIIPRNVFRGIGGKLTEASEELLTKGLGSPQELSKVKKISGMSNRDLFRKFNLYERTPEAIQEAISQVNKTRSSLIKRGSTINTSDLIKAFDKQINALSEDAKISNNAAARQSELILRKKALLKAIGGKKTLSIPTSRLDDIRALIGEDIPESTFGLSVGDLGKRGGTVATYRTVRDLIDEAAGTKGLGRKESALIKLKEISQKASNRAAARQNLNFTKLGGAAVGGTFKGIPGAITGFAAEQIANSPQFLSLTSRGLEKTGQVLEKARLPKLKYAKPIYNVGKGGRLVNSMISNRLEKTSPMARTMRTNQNRSGQEQPSLKYSSYKNPTPIKTKSQFIPKVNIPKSINYNPYKKSITKKGSFY